MSAASRIDTTDGSMLARGRGRLIAVAAFVALSLLLHVAFFSGFLATETGRVDREQPPPVSVSLLPAPEPPAVQEPPPKSIAKPPPAPKPKPRPPKPKPKPAPPPAEPAPPPPAPAIVDATRMQAPSGDELAGLDAAGDGDATPSAGPEAGREQVEPPPAATTPSVDAVASAVPEAPAEAEAAPTLSPPTGPVRLEYQVFYDDYRLGNRVATISQQFDSESDRYRMHSEARATGLVAWVWRGVLAQTSEGTMGPRGLVPQRYDERRGERAPRGAVIDAGRATARFVDGREAPAPAGTQDRLSILVQLGLLLSTGRAPAPGETIEVPLLANSRVDRSRWQVEGAESLDLQPRALETIRLRRIGDPGEEASLEAWYEPGRPWPVRMRVTDVGGRALDQILSMPD